MENKTIGIYGIFRKSDDKCVYIGQSIDCERRIRLHLYGYSNTPIENKDDYYADIIEKHGFNSTEFRLSREAFWINVFEPEWNKMCDRTHCEETRQKLREAHLGKTMSEESKQKNREAHLGENNTMYGKHHSEEAIQKMRESHLGKTPSEETRQKLREAHLDKHHSEETKQKIAEHFKGKHWKVVDGKRIWY